MSYLYLVRKRKLKVSNKLHLKMGFKIPLSPTVFLKRYSENITNFLGSGRDTLSVAFHRGKVTY